MNLQGFRHNNLNLIQNILFQNIIRNNCVNWKNHYPKSGSLIVKIIIVLLLPLL